MNRPHNRAATGGPGDMMPKPTDSQLGEAQARVIQEAETIARTGKAPNEPAPVGVTSDAAVGTDGARSGDPTPRPEPPADPAEFLDLAEVAVNMTDRVFVILLPAAGAMDAELRAQAITAWSKVMAKYMPAVFAKLGPETALLAAYGAHLAPLVLSWQTSEPSPDSSDKMEPAKHTL